MKKRVLAAAVIALIAVPLFAAGAEAKSHHGKTCVEIIKSQDVTMDKGKTHVYVVNMNGQKMVAIPADMAPDPLHQQLFTYQ